ncbi:MAG: DegV family protein [Anaerolineaceae bacterium]|nr:DegV family protein [Anaerolineaceae bacterium]
MNKVMIVTDSTANIPPELLNGNPVVSLPLQVIWGNEIYRDGIDIQPKEFYERLAVDKVLPSTSQVTPEEFKNLYSRLISEGYDILSIHISGKLSGTMASAQQAKRAFPNARIELIDSNSTSMALGFQVLSASRMAETGGSLAECKAVATAATRHSGVFFVLNTLEFLHRGGRIGGAQAFLGHMLNLKPLLEVRDGRIEAVERVRTLSKATDRMLDLVEAKIKDEPGPIRLCAVHANAPADAEKLLNQAVKRFPSSLISDAVISTVSPVLGTHTGPGALGLVYMAGM